MKKIDFTKMHGLGNDFLIINNFDRGRLDLNKSRIIQLCRRHFGIGADGILEILSPEDSSLNDCQVIIYNADGSQAEMCGNGIRCISHYLTAHEIISGREQRIETAAGIIKPELLKISSDKTRAEVRVNLGRPKFKSWQIPVAWEGTGPGEIISQNLTVQDRNFTVTAVSMGNPHAVIFIKEDPDEFPLEKWGPRLEKHSYFPEKTNIEIARVLSRDEIKLRVWERGSGLTLACGTGAAAALAAAVKNKLTGKEAAVNLPGGKLKVSWQDQNIFITGPSKMVFTGKFNLN